MDLETAQNKEHSPYIQILLLLGYAILGAFVFTILAMAILAAVYGSSVAQSMGEIAGGQITNLNALKIFQIVSSIGMFVVPPVILAYRERKKPKHFFGLYQPKAILIFIVLAVMVISMPVMEWAAALNQKLVLPDFLKGLEQLMRQKEDELAKLTIELITVRSPWDFFVNLIMIALLPAIGEELMFRGGLQRALKRMFGNPHAAIWLAAIIFSAIHMQFYGFLPRMLLGAGFGYLYYYSGNLYYAMIGHFLNNGYAVCVAYYMQLHGIPLENADQPIGFGWYTYLISAIITIALFIIFKRNTEHGRKLG